MRYSTRISCLLTSLALCSVSGAVFASCGSAFCAINTNEDALGPWVKPGLRMDLRGEYVQQDTLRSGRDKKEPSGIPGTHDEVKTLNRNYFASFDYSWNETWGASLQIPWLSRFHQHIENDPINGRIPEQWNFQKLGDVRVIGRYQFMGLPKQARTAGIQVGLKLPTGSTRIQNDDGERAERTMQPGTGTTDAILGAYYSQPIGNSRSSWFAQASIVSALNSNEDFRPGRQLIVNVGANYAINDTLSALIQLNAIDKNRDSGDQAEPDESGGRQVFVSPGFSVAVNRDARLYGFVQLPVYQYVNGTQLTADRAFVVGWGQVF